MTNLEMYTELSSNNVSSVYWKTGFVRLPFLHSCATGHRTVVATTVCHANGFFLVLG